MSDGGSSDLVVVLGAHVVAFAPRLSPGRFAASALGALDRETALGRDAVGRQEAEFRGRDQQLALARQRPDRPLVVVGRYGQDNAAVGRRGGLLRPRFLRGGGDGRGDKQRESGEQATHQFFLRVSARGQIGRASCRERVGTNG